jgi:hypothetical protein
VRVQRLGLGSLTSPIRPSGCAEGATNPSFCPPGPANRSTTGMARSEGRRSIVVAPACRCLLRTAILVADTDARASAWRMKTRNRSFELLVLSFELTAPGVGATFHQAWAAAKTGQGTPAACARLPPISARAAQKPDECCAKTMGTTLALSLHTQVPAPGSAFSASPR